VTPPDGPSFGWRWTGRERPPFAEPTSEGEESVWNFPRPPRLESDPRRVNVRLDGLLLADSARCIRVLETASPPTWYLPPEDVRTDLLAPASGTSHCEWKGTARYWSVIHPDGRVVARAAWSYPNPLEAFVPIRGWLAFKAGPLECSVGGRPVRPQGGGIYGGWITEGLRGPFKGDPGAGAW
jgi:uncharacterized protein (DUF427 family)